MVSFDDLTDYTEKIKQEQYASGTALVIMQNNKIVHEYYSGTHHFEQGARKINASSQFNVYSVRVTYIGLAVAIAMEEGYLDIDDKLTDHLPELDKEVLGETKIRHLVTRCTGLKIKEQHVTRAFALGTDIEGKRPDLLASILYQATGKTVAEILREKVFSPLDWTKTEWMTSGKETLVCDIHSPKSYPALRVGSNAGDDRNLYVSARELAYWGNLHLNKGSFNGKRILPEKIFTKTTTSQSPITVPNYLPKFGFLWWIKDSEVSYQWDELGSNLPEGSYQILGASSCSCTVIPKLNAVAVRMNNRIESSKEFDYLADIRRFGDLVVTCLK
ncbi:serine hydrolase [Ornithinibacillus sp. L9]|uniref:Serine hydrolase n=1 Tax=Ornithinibacillus caprae TaxID=2678566 RepID=A0A6N8FEV3_9BACI|nr:serine hydrolase domain-containing protein [Ornithinibacillus caprae]MUK87955.1 serine hydrolase [Ornithinibacillus caprae]